MNKVIIFFIFIIFINGCSLNKNSKFWTKSKDISKEKQINFKEISSKEETLDKELNVNVSINLVGNIIQDFKNIENFNNEGRYNYEGILKKSSRYKFSKIKNFYQFEPSISFHNNNVIFFDSNGSILQFDDKSKLIWKKKLLF